VDEHQHNSNSPPGSNTTSGLKHGNNGSTAKFLTVPGKNSFGKSILFKIITLGILLYMQKMMIIV
jgi:hypothetical protein